MNVKEKLQALLTASNTTTGETDTTLTDAVQSLIDGFGGGGEELPYTITYGEFTPASDLVTYTFEHGKSTVPDMVFVWCKDAVLNTIVATQVAWLAVFTSLPIVGVFGQWRRNTSTGDLSSTTNSGSSSYITCTETSVNLTTYNTSHFIRSGKKYEWMCLWI